MQKTLDHRIANGMARCPKLGATYYLFPNEVPPPDQVGLNLIEKAFNFRQEVFKNLYPGGHDVSNNFSNTNTETVEETRRLLKDDDVTIYNARFEGAELSASIPLVVVRKKQIVMVAVKSSSNLKDSDLTDITIKSLCMADAGFKPSRILIAHPNRDFILKNEMDYYDFISVLDMTLDVKRNEKFMRGEIQKMKDALKQGYIPQVSIGHQCRDQHWSCPLMEKCWEHTKKKNSIFEISHISKKAVFSLYEQDIHTFDEIPFNFKLSEKQWQQVNCAKSEKMVVNKSKLMEFLEEELKSDRPLIFTDFESHADPVPRYVGLKPWEQIPFLWSIHKRLQKGGKLHHEDYFCAPNNDPRLLFIKTFLKATEKPKNATILVYNASFEVTRLKVLSGQFPEFSNQIDERISRIRDLMIPFRERWYYHPAMKGSYSIKKVLPALVPELSYSSLEINNGALAGVEYERMLKVNNNERKKIERNLREYVKMDTLAMVKVLEVLESTVESIHQSEKKIKIKQ